MLHKQAITVVPKEQAAKGFHSSVPKKDGGTRPVINLKMLNTFVETPHFKMEGIHLLKDVLKEGDWMAKTDLKDAYFMILIDPAHQQLLRFEWAGQTYQFKCLPFGLWVL